MGANRTKLDLVAASLFFNTYLLPVTSVGLRGAIQHTAWLADHGYSPLVFPEGKRTADGKLLPFRPGIGVIVKETGLRVVPIVLHGAFEIWPEQARGPGKGDVHIRFGAPFDFSRQRANRNYIDSRIVVSSKTMKYDDINSPLLPLSKRFAMNCCSGFVRTSFSVFS